MKHVFKFSSLSDSLRGTMLKLCLLCLILIGGGNLSLQAAISGKAVENSLEQGSQQKERLLRGTVTDKSGQAIPGVAVQVKGTDQGAITDADGGYYIMVKDVENPVLVFSFMGMQTQEIAFEKGKHVINVTMQESQQEMEEVVVTGIFTRKTESFTGSATTFGDRKSVV